VYAHHIFFIHSSVDGLLGWFSNFAIVISGMNVQVAQLYADLHSSGVYWMKSDIAASFGSFIFSFLRNLYIDHCRGCTNLYFHRQYIRVPRLHPCQCWCVFSWRQPFWLRWISLMAKDVRYLFSICTSLRTVCSIHIRPCINWIIWYFV
jgi:hypothetical protein